MLSIGGKRLGGLVTVGGQLPLSPSGLIETVFFGAEHIQVKGDFLVRNVPPTGGFRYTFQTPEDFGELSSIHAVGIPSANGTNEDIDLSSDYGKPGEAFDFHSETDTTITYSFTADEITLLDVSSVFSALEALDLCGLQMNHNLSGGATWHALGVLMRYVIA